MNIKTKTFILIFCMVGILLFNYEFDVNSYINPDVTPNHQPILIIKLLNMRLVDTVHMLLMEIPWMLMEWV